MKEGDKMAIRVCVADRAGREALRVPQAQPSRPLDGSDSGS